VPDSDDVDDKSGIGAGNVTGALDDLDSRIYSDEDARDATAAMLSGGNNVTLTHDDANDTLTIDASGGDGYSDEEARDAAAAMLSEGKNITLTYDDENDVLTVKNEYDDSDVKSLINRTKNDTSSGDLWDFKEGELYFKGNKVYLE